MNNHLLRKTMLAETIGSLFFFATVIGSGIMAQSLAGGNVAIALLGNNFATGAILFVLITIWGAISGAPFNPAVTLVARLRHEIDTRAALAHVLAQFAGRILGTVRMRPKWVPATVALYITAAYWFTSSTSFVNPAITIARLLSDSFAGIAPSSAPGFIIAQLVGALAANAVSHVLFSPFREASQ